MAEGLVQDTLVAIRSEVRVYVNVIFDLYRLNSVEFYKNLCLLC
jgi:hypothetical protein